MDFDYLFSFGMGLKSFKKAKIFLCCFLLLL